MASIFVAIICFYLVLKNSTGIQLVGNVSRRQLCIALFLLIIASFGVLSELGFMIGRFGEFKREYSHPGLFQIPGHFILPINILRVVIVSSILLMTSKAAAGNMVLIAWLRRLMPVALVLESLAASGYKFARIDESLSPGETFGAWVGYYGVVFITVLIYGYAMLVLRRIRSI